MRLIQRRALPTNLQKMNLIFIQLNGESRVIITRKNKVSKKKELREKIIKTKLTKKRKKEIKRGGDRGKGTSK